MNHRGPFSGEDPLTVGKGTRKSATKSTEKSNTKVNTSLNKDRQGHGGSRQDSRGRANSSKVSYLNVETNRDVKLSRS